MKLKDNHTIFDEEALEKCFGPPSDEYSVTEENGNPVDFSKVRAIVSEIPDLGENNE